MIDVSVCICTFRRPAGVLRLLRSLRSPDPSTPRHEIIVVDNEAGSTAEPSIRQVRAEGLEVQYVVEPVRGIARARNRSLERATGEYVAFIDDDEEAAPRWLVDLWGEVVRAGADGGVGPVIPRFSDGAPRWLIEGGFCERPRTATGTILRAKETRTGNALIRRRLLMALPGPFDERYNFSGGEDSFLFARLIDGGHRFIAVDSAIVYEHLTPARTTVRRLLRRRFLGSMGAARLDSAGAPVRGKRWRSARPLAAAVAWGALGLLLFPALRVHGFDRLSRGAQQLGRFAFLNGLSYRPYLDDSWR
jgi:succinoglycan biosynthesis protein ExoM